MFQNGKGRLFELFDQIDCGVDIEHVIVRDLFSVQFIEEAIQITKEHSALMGILAITQCGALNVALFEYRNLLLTVEVVEDSCIVV